MKKFTGIMVLAVALFLIPPLVWAGGYLPEAASKALLKSQGELLVRIPVLGGEKVIHGSAILLDSVGWIATAYDNIPLEVDVLKSNHVTFNGIPAYLEYASPKSKLALLRLKEVPKNMEPALMNKKIELPAEVFGVSPDTQLDSQPRVDFKAVEFKAWALSKTDVIEYQTRPGKNGSQSVPVKFSEVILLDRPLKLANPGSLMVNSQGLFAGMLIGAGDDVSLLMSSEAVGGLLRLAQAEIEKRLKNGALSSKETAEVEEKFSLIREMSNLYAQNALDRPKNIADCVTEMMAMSFSGKCRDRFTHYFPPVAAKEMADEINSVGFGGVGMTITDRDGQVVVVSPIDDTPAARAGIKAGDVILEINGEKPQSADEARTRIRGDSGTEVTITIGRKDVKKPLEFKIARAQIIVKSVVSRLISGDKPVGYIKVNEFQAGTREEFRAAVENYYKQGLPVVLDFRNDPGGLFDTALWMLGLYMGDKDVAVTTKERNSSVSYDRSAIEARLLLMGIDFPTFGVFSKMKLVILVNGGSASASEIFSGTMKDWGYTVVGEKTFGKGVGQTIFPLSDHSTFSLTTFEFLVGNNKVAIRDKGVTPNVEVKNSDKPDDKTDYQLEKALEILRAK